MSIIILVIFGGLVGWIASLLMSTDAEQGTFFDIGVGIVGAVIGGWIMSVFGASGISGFNLYSFFVALLGACIGIVLLRVFKR